MATYNHTSWTQFRQLCARRASDSNMIFWTDVEWKRYTLEVLRTWNALSWMSRDRMTFNTINGQAFYDLPSQAGSLLPYTLKDQDLLQDIQANLIAPLVSNAWTGTTQFTLQDIQDALEKVRNQFLYQTGIVLAHSTLSAPPAGSGRMSIPTTSPFIHFRRVAYQPNVPANSIFTRLSRSDEFTASAYRVGWSNNPSTPTAYSTISTPKVSLQLIPPNVQGGTVDLVTVNAGAALNLSTGVLLGMPDDLAWVVKYGALADLLSREGIANDPLRANYCKTRYGLGMEVAKQWNTIQHPQINGVSLIPTTLQDSDDYNAGWQAPGATGKPVKLIVAGPNLIALTPLPDTGPYSITMDVVRNHPVPVNDGDFIQVGQEELNVLVDGAVHIAAFKQGGQEFTDTYPLAENMLALAQSYNRTLKVTAPSFEAMKDQTRKPYRDVRVEVAA